MHRNQFQKLRAALTGGSRRQKLRLSKQTTFRGKQGIAYTSINPLGSAVIEGELWKATSNAQIEKGLKVRVVGTDGVLLLVEPIA